jgi:hypothetical protein
VKQKKLKEKYCKKSFFQYLETFFPAEKADKLVTLQPCCSGRD